MPPPTAATRQARPPTPRHPLLAYRAARLQRGAVCARHRTATPAAPGTPGAHPSPAISTPNARAAAAGRAGGGVWGMAMEADGGTAASHVLAPGQNKTVAHQRGSTSAPTGPVRRTPRPRDPGSRCGRQHCAIARHGCTLGARGARSPTSRRPANEPRNGIALSRRPLRARPSLPSSRHGWSARSLCARGTRPSGGALARRRGSASGGRVAHPPTRTVPGLALARPSPSAVAARACAGAVGERERSGRRAATRGRPRPCVGREAKL